MQEFYDTYLQIPSSRERRDSLNEQMSIFETQNLSCRKCIGNCCTFTSNSMMITPIEAFDILSFLMKSKDFRQGDLIESLQETINEFRLDQNSTGIRKTYTCPFYTGESKGCTISKHSKPYGCLAFLPSETNIKKGTSCLSKIDSLVSREKVFGKKENLTNELLISELNLSWKKLSIPEAVLDIIKKGEHLLSPKL
jgi:Fe-S-cluster containining protein